MASMVSLSRVSGSASLTRRTTSLTLRDGNATYLPKDADVTPAVDSTGQDGHTLYDLGHGPLLAVDVKDPTQ